MRTRTRALRLAACLAMAPAAASAEGTLLTNFPGYAFGNPEVDESGLHAVIERKHYVDGPYPPGCSHADGADFVVLDLSARCGHDVLREVPCAGSRWVSDWDYCAQAPLPDPDVWLWLPDTAACRPTGTST